uniref:G-protein coupled receptors family 1 profile domain-containing protein n=1 Tax=Ditylenchus dipsaci TaxID=166011 RepID=A0A915E6Q1_9BILA
MHLFKVNDSYLFTNSCLDHLQPLYADDLRLAVVGISGTTVALLSVVENVVLFYVFLSSRKLRRQNYANPVFLASSDIVVSMCYLFMESLHFFAYKLHTTYMRYTYSLQHFALTVSNFLLVVASLERYLAYGPLYSQRRVLVWMVRYKPLVVAMIVLLAFVLKASTFLENGLIYLPMQCEDRIVPVWKTGQQGWRFWLRKLLTIILPFLLLLYCNFYIVVKLRLQNRNYAYSSLLKQRSNGCECRKSQKPCKNVNRNTEKNTEAKMPKPCALKSCVRPTVTQFLPKPYQEKRGVRVATRTLVMVVGCYLIANSTTTLLNIWEYFDRSFLRHQHYYAYLIGSDLAALLTIWGCALRLPIYVVNDQRIRKAMFRAVLRWKYCLHGQLNDMDVEEGQLEKWSIVIVSNSLRSNLTGILSQLDFATFKGKRSFDQLAVLVQNRRSFLVQMTINLGSVQELHSSQAGKPVKANMNREGGGESTTFLTDIQEESLLDEHEDEQQPILHSHLLPNDSKISGLLHSKVQYFYRSTTGCISLNEHPSTDGSKEDALK